MVECHIFGSHENPHELSNHPAPTLPHSRTLTSSWGRTPPPAFAKSHVRRPWGPWGFLMVYPNFWKPPKWTLGKWMVMDGMDFQWFSVCFGRHDFQFVLESGWYGFSVCFGRQDWNHLWVAERVSYDEISQPHVSYGVHVHWICRRTLKLPNPKLIR